MRGNTNILAKIAFVKILWLLTVVRNERSHRVNSKTCYGKPMIKFTLVT